MFKTPKKIFWVGSSYKDLLELPKDVRRTFGYALSLAQEGERYDLVKVLKGFGGAGVLEVIADNFGDTYRAVYTVKFSEAIFVLHCFQKKVSKALQHQKKI
jgi:phage-related protein